MEKKTLYGLDKGGSFKLWEIWTVGNVIYISHGKEGGKMQLKTEAVAGKNIGRANETTPEAQAAFEAQSRINKQVDKGYREDKEDLTTLPILPMLATDFRKAEKSLQFPCYTSFKLDGVRCLAEKKDGAVSLKSRGGKFYDVAHIQDSLSHIMNEGEIWDGELYRHGWVLEEIQSAAKAPKASSKELVFVVFDIVNDLVFEERLASLYDLPSRLAATSFVSVLHYKTAKDRVELKKRHTEAVSECYEGLMMRNPKGVYESGKRSRDLLKYKEFLDSEFKIVDIIPDREGRAVFEVQNTFADNTFTVVGGSHAQRTEWLENKELYIGRWITVQYQTLYKDSRKPQFPTWVAFREGVEINGEFYPEV